MCKPTYWRILNQTYLETTQETRCCIDPAALSHREQWVFTYLSAILHQLIIAKSGCLANLSAIQHQLIITANTWKTYAVVLTIPKPVPRGKPDNSTNEEIIIGRLRFISQIQWASKHADPVLCWRVISSIIKSQIWRHWTIACTIKAPLYWRSILDCSALVQLSFDVHYVGFFLVSPSVFQYIRFKTI